MRLRWAQGLVIGEARFALLTAAIVAVVIAAQLRLVGDFRVDDAYISFAFAKNLALGRGLVFGHDLRVEGYTNFLWTVLNAFPIALCPDADPLLAARVLAVVALFGLLLASYRLARLFMTPAFASVAVLCLASWTDLTRAAVSGLETVPHAALLACGTLAYLRELAGERRNSLWWFAAAALMRISGIAMLAFVLGFELAVRIVDRRLAARELARWALPPVLVFGAYFVWRFAYYGLLWPTTYYAKSLVEAGDPDRGARYLWDALRDTGALVLVPFASIARANTSDRRLSFLGCAVVLEAACIAYVGGDWMPFNRFCVPLATPLLVLFAIGLRDVWCRHRHAPRATRAGVFALLTLSVAWVLVHSDAHHADSPQERNKLADATAVKRHTKDNLYRIRRFFAPLVRSPNDVLVTDYGGIVAFYTDVRIIEMWGLCNRDIALHGNIAGINPIYGKTCIDCYKHFDPDYFHVTVPIVRAPDALHSHLEVIAQIFQGAALDRVLHLRTRYATGRVLDSRSQRALFFIEKRKPKNALVPRGAAGGFVVDYPFEPGGRWSPIR